MATAILVSSSLLTASQAVATPKTEPSYRSNQAQILSAAWGTNNASSCPSGETGLDNIPVVFNWFLRPSTIDESDFVFTRDDGTTVSPTCALIFPPDERNERQTINVIGDFGDPGSARPATVTVTGGLQGHPIGKKLWRDLPQT